MNSDNISMNFFILLSFFPDPDGAGIINIDYANRSADKENTGKYNCINRLTIVEILNDCSSKKAIDYLGKRYEEIEDSHVDPQLARGYRR